MSDIKVNDSAAHAPEEIMREAKKLIERQGCPGVLAREASGYHLYIPCPDCLETHRRRELDDPKYAINLSMLVGHGEFRVIYARKGHVFSGMLRNQLESGFDRGAVEHNHELVRLISGQLKRIRHLPGNL